MANTKRSRLPNRPQSEKSVFAVLAQAFVFGVMSITPALADQNAKELPGLFGELAEVEDQNRANQIQQTVWGHWLTGPDDTSDALMLQIQTALELGRPQVGIELSNQLIDSYPEYAEAWNKRATFFYILNRLDESVADIKTTLDLEPNHFGALSGLGLILMRTGDAEGALAAFEAVLKINPLSLSAQQNAARAKDQLGTDI